MWCTGDNLPIPCALVLEVMFMLCQMHLSTETPEEEFLYLLRSCHRFLPDYKQSIIFISSQFVHDNISCLINASP